MPIQLAVVQKDMRAEIKKKEEEMRQEKWVEATKAELSCYPSSPTAFIKWSLRTNYGEIFKYFQF